MRERRKCGAPTEKKVHMTSVAFFFLLANRKLLVNIHPGSGDLILETFSPPPPVIVSASNRHFELRAKMYDHFSSTVNCLIENKHMKKSQQTKWMNTHISFHRRLPVDKWKCKIMSSKSKFAPKFTYLQIFAKYFSAEHQNKWQSSRFTK